MEAKISDVHEFIKYKLVDYNTLKDKFNAWFSGTLMGTKLPYDDMTNEELDNAQKAAEALCDKVEYMISETFEGKCDMDSIFRMLVRICDKGVKLIPNCKSEYMVDNLYGVNSKKLPGGYKRVLAHFRWNWTVYTLRPEYIEQLINMIKRSNYFELNPDARMCSLEENFE